MVMRMAAVLALAVLPAGGAGAAESLDFSATVALPVRYRDDAVRVVLTPEAARRARAALPERAAPAAWLGLPGLDHAVSSLGAVLEREFPDLPAERTGGIDLSRHWIARVPATTGRERSLSAFAAAPEVESAGPIAIVPVVRVPGDSLWSQSWHWYQPSRRDVHAPEAWDLTVAAGAGPVAVLDTGVLPWHPDLGGAVAGSAGNLWVNAAEAGGVPGLDDDGNGYVDDISGWDFVDLSADSLVQPGEDWRDEDSDPNDYAGHGTAVAGVIGAIGDNGIGATGAGWGVRVMPLRVGWSGALAASGEVDLSYAARAIVYAAVAGCVAINLSFATVNQEDLALAMDVATRLRSTLVVAAGNNGSPHAMGFRHDVLSVAATDASDQVTRFSNRGDYVDVAAPGLFIATTSLAKDLSADSVGLRLPDYTRGASGTSFSAPIVAGAVALLQAHRRERQLPPLAPVDVLLRVADTADDISGANPGVTGYGSGRVNLHRLLADPPASFALAARAVAAGAVAVLPTSSGSSRVVLASTDGRLLFADGADGATLRSVALPAPAAGGLAAADLGRASGPALFVPLADGRLAGYDQTGTSLPGWPVAATGSWPGATPALADVDGDGRTDVVWGGNDGQVYAWRAGGGRLGGFPRRIGGDGDRVRVALADLDGEPGDEIVATTSGAGVYVLRADGSSLDGWPRWMTVDLLPPVVTRLGDDPRPCIVVAGAAAVAVHDADGTTRWTRPLPGRGIGAPAVGDLDGDGSAEIVVPVAPDQVVVLDSGGSTVATAAVPGVAAGEPLPPAPMVAELTGGRRAVVASAGGMLHVFDRTGAALPGFPRWGEGIPAIADLDRDGRAEIVLASSPDSIALVLDAGAASWNPGHRGWLVDRANSARTGSTLAAAPAPVLDDIPPAGVDDLAVAGGTDTSLALVWTATGDDGRAGRPARYRILVEEQAPAGGDAAGGGRVFEWPATGEAGEREAASIGGLEPGRRYWISLRAEDDGGRLSPPSNVVSARTGPLAAKPSFVVLPAVQPARPPVALHWQLGSLPPGRPVRLDVVDVVGRCLRTLSLGKEGEGVVHWDGLDDGGRRVPSGVYFVRLAAGSRQRATRVVLLW
jgi:subtilisin family serine protease